MTPEGARSRFRGAFLGCLLGDSLGRPFEMMSARDTRLRPSLDALTEGAAPLRYTDDTKMMIAVAESLLAAGSVSREALLQSFSASYDPVRGYGHGMKQAIDAFRAGRSGDVVLSPTEGSKGAGASVRVVPIACAWHHDRASLEGLAEFAAGVTHAHVLGRAGAVLQALALAEALSSSRPFDPTEFLARIATARVFAKSTLPGKLLAVRQLLADHAPPERAGQALGNGVVADEAVPLALFAFLRWAPGFEEVVRNTILAGGDTDTCAAMSGALCGALVGEEGLPVRWLERVQEPLKGVEAVRDLADRVFAFWKAGRTG